MKYRYNTLFNKLFFFLILFFLLLTNASASHVETYKFVTKWGSAGTDNGSFGYPYGIAVDSSGDVYVVDTNNNRIQKFDSDGEFITKWGSSGNDNGSFTTPYSVAVDSSGNVYVVDMANNNVQKFDSDGEFITKWGSSGNGNGQFNTPQGIAVDPSGNVYVADTNNYRIQKFDSNGEFMTKWGSYGSGDGQFKDSIGIAVDASGSVYVSDFNNNCVQKFDSNGTFLTKWGSLGSDNGQLSHPSGIAVDSSGNVYVAETVNNRVQKFDSNGTFITKWGSYGSDNGSFANLYSVAVDSSGIVYVADTGNHRIQKFALFHSANFSTNVTSGNVPLTVQFRDLSENATGWNWDFGDGTNSTAQNVTHTFSAVGNYTVNLTVSIENGTDSYLTTINVSAQPVLPVANFSSNVTDGYAPLSVQFNDSSEDATAWNWNFGDGANSTQQNPTHVYSVKGNYTVNLTVSNVNGTNSKTAEITPYTRPYAYIPNQVSNNVSVIDTSNNRVVASVNVGSYPYGVAVNRNGTKVYVTNQGSYTVSVIDTSTNTVSATVKGLYYPQGVAVRPDGKKVYVVNYFGKNVSVIDTATNTITATVKVGDFPNGIAVNSAGTKVYVTNQGNNNISVIDTSNNTVVASVNVEGSPYGVAVNPDGTKVYAALYANGKVSVIDTSNNTVVASVNVGSTLYNLAVNPEGTKVYVACWLTDKVSVIDTSNNTVVALVNAVNSPYGITVNPKGTKVYVANYNSNTVSVIDTATNTVTTTVPVGNSPSAFGQFITIGVEAVLPVANFSSNVTSGYVPLSVQFTDLSENATALNWNFGDGNNSTQQNPIHTFSAAGNYTVNLTASNANGTGSHLATINVSAQPVIPVANFTSNMTSGYAPLSVQFNDSSENATGWYWDFGDGNNSSDRNPVHTFSAVGNFTVNLTASNANGTDSFNSTIAVQKATPQITWNDPEDIVYGTPLSSTQLSASASVNGTLAYTPATGTVLGVGEYTLQVDFAPEDTANYTNASANVSINITKATPEITWSKPADITYGIELNGTQLNASASVPGNFTYDPAEGTVLGVGNQTLNVDFTPTDTANYTNESENVTINVLQAVPEITWNNPQDIVYGTVLNGTQLNAVASTNGTLIYTPANGTVLGVGQHTLQVDLTPEDSVNYTNAAKNVTINITSTIPTITWSNPVDIVYGTALNSTQLNASASVPGNFTYDPTTGTILDAGQHSLHVDFTPTDAANYTNAAKNVTINVSAQTVLPVANFSTNVTEGYAPLSVQFNDNSDNAIEWNWDFGDGTNSTEKNPIHTYSSKGNYAVNLTVSNGNGTNSAFSNITVLEQQVFAGANLFLSENTLESKHSGSSMNYTLYYQNFGDRTAQNVVLEDVLSSDVEFESASDGGIYNNSMNTIRWDIGSVAPAEYGYRTVTVEIPQSVSNGTVIYNNASINTSDNESRYDDNEISIQTIVATQNLPQNVNVEPTIGDAGIPSVYWGEPITFSYHSCDSATGVNISIHLDDGQPDINGVMTGGPVDWNYTTTFYPRIGKATVNYTVYGCDQATESFSIYIDPAGFVYDMDTENRIPNASVWLQRPDGEGGWENVPTGQHPAIAHPDTNPLTTDENGMYQWDVLNGTYRVHVEATGYEPKNSYAVMIPPAVTDLHVGLVLKQNENYSIFKSVIAPDESGDCIINSPGDEIPYRIVVKNEGVVNLTGISVNDSMISLTGPAGDDGDPGVLNPGEIWVYNGIYTLTPADINNGTGFINNTATVSCNELPEKNSSVATPIAPKVDLSIYKSVTGIDEAGDYMIDEPGDVINYQIAVKNNGDVDLHNVNVTDSLIDTLSGPTGDSVDPGVLNPGETWVYTGNYTVTQDVLTKDGDDGSGLIKNTATVSCNEHAPENSIMELPIIHIPPIVVTPGSESSNALPVADFSTNITSGTAPLSVKFTDISQNATSRNWDFNGDGIIDSSEVNPVYTYTAPGPYTANLTAINANGITSKTLTINVLEATSPSDGSSGSSSGSSGGSSSGSSGGSGGSAEPASNVEAKEISQAFISSGQSVRFDFPKNVTPVLYLSFDSKKTFGKTSTIVEMLKGKSTLVSGLPSDEVYKFVNIWIGDGRFVTSNIENAVVCFKVEKSWVQDKKIDQSSIALNRYSDNKWEQLQTSKSGEDETYLYFTAKTLGFSPFAITGKTTATGTEIQSGTSAQNSEQNNGNTGANAEQTSEQKNNTSTPAKESKKTPGFEIICGITGLLAVYLYRRRK